MKNLYEVVVACLAIAPLASCSGINSNLPLPGPISGLSQDTAIGPVVMPSVTTSHYVCGSSTSINTQNYYFLLGLAQGALGVNGVVVLDFGQPTKKGGKYGTYLPLHCGFVSTDDIHKIAALYLEGFKYSLSEGGSGALTLGIGTNNCGGSGCAKATCNTSVGGVTPDHAEAWAGVVKELQQEYKHYGVTVVGASDMELCYNTFATTKAWVDAYSKATQQPLYNYGDAQGCPQSGNGKTNGKCDQNWTQSDVWYISASHSGGQPLPEIYSNGAAKEWYHLSLYAYNNHKAALNFLGALTERGACGCFYTPDQAYAHLSTLLNSNPHTAQSLPYASDITKDQYQTFNYTGGAQQFKVPAGVTRATIFATGAVAGGIGGYLQATIPVKAQERLAVFVGGASVDSAGGFNGGGNGGAYTGKGTATPGFGGGGATDVRQDGKAFANRVVVVGGAGGTGFQGGGEGGGLIGGAGYGNGGGGGGTQSSGGVGGSGGGSGSCQGSAGTNGALGAGGTGGSTNCSFGGGGGVAATTAAAAVAATTAVAGAEGPRLLKRVPPMS